MPGRAVLQANIAIPSVMIAAHTSQRFLPMLVTAAATVKAGASCRSREQAPDGSDQAGLGNELFHMDKTMMVFGDAKKVVEGRVKAVE